jgi:hypothetical protein
MYWILGEDIFGEDMSPTLVFGMIEKVYSWHASWGFKRASLGIVLTRDTCAAETHTCWRMMWWSAFACTLCQDIIQDRCTAERYSWFIVEITPKLKAYLRSRCHQGRRNMKRFFCCCIVYINLVLRTQRWLRSDLDAIVPAGYACRSVAPRRRVYRYVIDFECFGAIRYH